MHRHYGQKEFEIVSSYQFTFPPFAILAKTQQHNKLANWKTFAVDMA